MSQNPLTDLVEITRLLQEDPRSLREFHAWVRANQSALVTEFSEGELLKLKHGSTQDILRIAIRFRNPCLHCTFFSFAKTFESRKDFENSMRQFEKLLSGKIYERITCPSWFISNGGYVGAEAFFKCTVCSAIWQLAIPEKEENGSIARIA